MSSIADVLYRNFAQAVHRRDYAEADRILERLEHEEPASLRSRASRLELLVKSGRISDARAMAKDLAAAFPDSGRVLFFAGRVAYAERKYDEAVRHFGESERLHASPYSRLWLGKALRESGQLDQAEALLRPLTETHPECMTELAWIYERKGDRLRALEAWRDRMKTAPQDAFAKRQHDRLLAETMPPADLVADLDALEAWGEPVPEHLLAGYVDALLKTGQGGRARAIVAPLKASLSARAALQAAWAAHRMQAFDLSFELFVIGFRANRSNTKFLSALERAAKKCGKTAELLELYGAQAPESKNLYGRIKSLEKEGSKP